MRLRRSIACVALGLVLSGCQPASDQADPEMSDVPVGAGGLPTDAVLWALGDTIHVDDRTIRVDRRVSAMVEANGWIFYRKGYSDVVWATDGEESRRTSLRTDELAASESGRYLGLLDHSRGKPWSTVIVDLESGEVVVRDGAGMGNPEGDLTDLYEDAQPRVLGFDGERLLVQTASGNEVMSWDPRTGERTEHGDQFFFAGRDPGGGLIQPALVRRGRLVVPKDDPFRSTTWAHASPDGTVAVMPVGNGSQVFEVGGRWLPTDLHGRRFILGGWTDDETAYGIAFDRSPFGPNRVRLVSCRLTVEQRRCRVLRTIRPAPHELVHFPHGSAARDY